MTKENEDTKTKTPLSKSELKKLLFHHLRAATIAIFGGVVIMLIVGTTWETFSVFFIFSTGRIGEYFDLKCKLKRMVE